MNDGSSESVPKSVTRSLVNMASASSAKLKDVASSSHENDHPVLTGFVSDKVSPEDLSSSLLSSGYYVVGILSGIMAGLAMIYYWWIFIALIIIFCLLTAFAPKMSDSLVSGLLLTIQGIYLPFKHAISTFKEKMSMKSDIKIH